MIRSESRARLIQDTGHSQLDTSGGSDAQDYEAQINALMEGRLPPSLGPSSSGATSSGLSGGFGFSSSAATPTAKAMPKSSTSYDPSMPDFPRGRGQQDQEDPGCHEEHCPDDSYTFQQQIPSFAADFTASMQESL